MLLYLFSKHRGLLIKYESGGRPELCSKGVLPPAGAAAQHCSETESLPLDFCFLGTVVNQIPREGCDTGSVSFQLCSLLKYVSSRKVSRYRAVPLVALQLDPAALCTSVLPAPLYTYQKQLRKGYVALTRELLKDQRMPYAVCASFNPANSKGGSFVNGKPCAGVSEV